MSVTVWGVATAAGEPSAHRDRFGQLTDAHMYRRFDPQLPADGIDVDLDHDGQQAGTLVYGEVDRAERVNLVSVIDDGDWLLELDRPVYYSPVLDMRGCSGDHVYVADSATIIGLSLTLTPARVGSTPLKLIGGDIRSRADRGSWPATWSTQHCLLGRAVEQLPRQRSWEHRAHRIVGPPIKVTETRDGFLVHDNNGGYVLAKNPTRPPGGMRYGPAGRIISVR